MYINLDKSKLDGREYDSFTALSVKGIYSDLLTGIVRRDEAGDYFAEKSILLSKFSTKHRGDILLCTADGDKYEGAAAGQTWGLAELVEVKRADELTEDELREVCNPDDRGKYAWIFRNPRRVIEMPILGSEKLFEVHTFPGEVMEYPREVEIGEDGWKRIQKRIKK